MIAPILRSPDDLLVGLRYSPWTERTRFALDVLRVPYRFVDYLPMVSEPMVRLRMRSLRGQVSAPLWIPRSGPVIVDSAAIARAVDHERILFPTGEDEAVDRWERISQEATSAIRARVLDRTAASPEAREASLPPFVPRVLRPHLRGVTSVALSFIRAKYGARPDDVVVERALDALRAGLAGGKRHVVGDRLTFADLAMATVLQGVAPVDDRWLPLVTPLRAVWRDDRLAGLYADLVVWRDALYAEHRRPAENAATTPGVG